MVRMGPLIGSGGYGRVYRASFNDKQVAIKVGRSACLPFAMLVPPAAAGQQSVMGYCLVAALSSTCFIYQGVPIRVNKSLLRQLPAVAGCPDLSCSPLLGS